MKKELVCLIMILFSWTLSAQDTLFTKSGEVIPAVIISKDNTEIRYKKFAQKDSPAVYSVFISDLKSIHYSDGLVADYISQAGISTRRLRPIDEAGKMGIAKFSFGMAATRFNRASSDELLDFWQLNPLLNNKTPVECNPVLYPLELRMNMVLGQARRHWIGTGLELIFTPDDFITAKSTDGKDEIRLKGFYYNIPLYYGHTVNHRKTVIFIFEPALNLATLSGNIKVNSQDYKVSMNFGTGMTLSAGFDWIMTKRLLVSLRAGQRYLKVKESHESEASSTGYSSFYTIPPGTDLLTINVNGPFVSAGLSWSMYLRMKGFRPE